MIYSLSGSFIYQPPIAGFPGEFSIDWIELSDNDPAPYAAAGDVFMSVCQGYPHVGFVPLRILDFENSIDPGTYPVGAYHVIAVVETDATQYGVLDYMATEPPPPGWMPASIQLVHKDAAGVITAAFPAMPDTGIYGLTQRWPVRPVPSRQQTNATGALGEKEGGH